MTSADAKTVSRASAAGRRGTAANEGGAAGAALFGRYFIYALIAVAVAAVLLAILSIQRYRNYYGGRFDLGNMVQAVYNTAHGHLLEITTTDGKQMSRLGAHVDPVLAAFALPWLVLPSPIMLLVLQAIIVALAGWPAYRLGVRLLGDARAAFYLTVALLLYPPLQYAVLNEFHPVTLAIPLLLFAFLYVEEDRWWRALPFLVVAALCKEDVPLVIAVMGAYFALRKRSWWPLVLTAAAVAYFVVAVKVILPHYSPGGSPFLSRYSEYGSSEGQIVKNVFLKPGTTAQDLFSWSNVKYLFHLLWPFAFTPLLSPLTALIALPTFLLNALSANPFQRSYQFHYVATEAPFLFAAATLGVARLHRWLTPTGAAAARAGRGARRSRRAATSKAARKAAAAKAAVPKATGPATTPKGGVSLGTLAGVVLAASLAANFFLGPLPFSLPGAHYSGRDYAVSGHAKVLDMAVKMIPAGATVSTENDAGSHLSARRRVFTFPYQDGAQWVVVDDKHPYWFDKPDRARHSQALGTLVLNQAYQSVFARDGVYVFKKVGAPGSSSSGAGSPPASPSPSASP